MYVHNTKQECSPTAQRGAISYLSEVIFAAMNIVGMILGTDQLLGQNLPALLAVNIPFCQSLKTMNL